MAKNHNWWFQPLQQLFREEKLQDNTKSRWHTGRVRTHGPKVHSPNPTSRGAWPRNHYTTENNTHQPVPVQTIIRTFVLFFLSSAVTRDVDTQGKCASHRARLQGQGHDNPYAAHTIPQTTTTTTLYSLVTSLTAETTGEAASGTGKILRQFPSHCFKKGTLLLWFVWNYTTTQFQSPSSTGSYRNTGHLTRNIPLKSVECPSLSWWQNLHDLLNLTQFHVSQINTQQDFFPLSPSLSLCINCHTKDVRTHNEPPLASRNSRIH